MEKIPSNLKSNKKYITISPRDFIHGPYIQCPKCGKDTFGVLMICSRHYCRRCSSCFWPRGTERGGVYPLPELRKKIIYLDQCAISDMMKAINPKTRAHRDGRVDPFWRQLFERLDSLCKFQLIICPDSDFHKHESLLSPFYKALHDLYEHLSHGVSFYDHETIHRFQVMRQLGIWLKDKREPEIDVKSIVHGDLHCWQERYRITIGESSRSALIDELRNNRDKVDEYLQPIFQRWQRETEKDFDYWYQQEIKANAGVLVELYERQLKEFAMASYGLKPFSLGAFMPNMATATFQGIKDVLQRHGIAKEQLNSKLGEFLRSEEFEETPHMKISSLLYAAMARKAASGRKKPPSKGFKNDVDIVSTLLPYCDAMFVDNEIRNFLSERPLRDRLKYKTKVFSFSNKEEFIQYLNDIKKAAPKAHFDKVKEVYSEDWGKPFVEMYEKGAT